MKTLEVEHHIEHCIRHVHLDPVLIVQYIVFSLYHSNHALNMVHYQINESVKWLSGVM